MKRIIEIGFIAVFLWGCDRGTHQASFPVEKNINREQLAGMHWANPPELFEVVDSTLSVTVAQGTDYFNNPEDGSATGSAPFLYAELEGNFVIKALVEPDFSSQWNAVALMVHRDSLNWIKFAFENSDATGPGIVSVVTRGSSDDANGAVLKDLPRVWLAIARKDEVYAMHWSVDGEHYRMARLAALPGVGKVKAGIEVQSPVGELATHRIHYFHAEKKTVKNLRDLNE